MRTVIRWSIRRFDKQIVEKKRVQCSSQVTGIYQKFNARLSTTPPSFVVLALRFLPEKCQLVMAVGLSGLLGGQRLTFMVCILS